MKKMLVLAMVLFAGASASYGLNPSDYKVFYKLNNLTTFSNLMNYLDADYDQSENLKYIFQMTESQMKKASKTEDIGAGEKAMYFNLANAKNILSEDQYKKYLVMLNLSIDNNNNFNEVLLTDNER